MKHATSRMLFAYWDALRGERVAPDRGDLQPSHMRHVLADAFILEAGPDRPAAFRLAGTRCCALFGRDLKGMPFHAAWPVGMEAEADRLVTTVSTDVTGLVVGLIGANENGSEIPLELLLLPLRHRGRTESRLLGSLSPVTLPSWAGLVPLRSLETRSLRVVTADTRTDICATLDGADERRRRFIVHEGGRDRASQPAFDLSAR